MASTLPSSLQRDVIVIGGGPAGSTAATVLAQRGHKVRLIEKTQHPRFHIGESLLPENLKLLEKLGVLDKVRQMGIHKSGAEFILDPNGESHEFHFSKAIDNAFPHAYQVKRAEFDEVLFRNAANRGATTFENTQVTRAIFSTDNSRIESLEVQCDGEKQFWHADWFFDASGRDTLCANGLGSKTHNKHNNTAAIYGHFTGISPKPNDPLGHIRIHLGNEGWMWMIPLQDGITSVGLVASPQYLKQRSNSLPEFFMQHCRQNPHVWERMQSAELQGDIQATGNYSYLSGRMHGENYALLGDAFGFIDPVFSTGVLLAMSSGHDVANIFCDTATQPQKRLKLLKRYQKHYHQKMQRICWFIYRINSPAFRQLTVSPRNVLGIEKAVISVLSGDFRRGWRFTFPLLLFKGVYHIKHRQLMYKKRQSTRVETRQNISATS